jgi:hypothetical protein
VVLPEADPHARDVHMREALCSSVETHALRKTGLNLLSYCQARGRGEKCMQSFGWNTRRAHLEDVVVDVRIILK